MPSRIAISLLLALASASGLAVETTPVGAERAGNVDGTIPAWDGGLTQAPGGDDPLRHEVDPFPDDRPLVIVSPAELARHEALLSDGQRELFRRFPGTWRMAVYPTRRSAAYPAWVYDAIQRNAEIAAATPEAMAAVRLTRVTSPFPAPRSGEEVVWNHVLRWRGMRVSRHEGIAAVTARGRYVAMWVVQDIAFPYGLPWGVRRGRFENVVIAGKSKVLLPAQQTGLGVLVHETLDQSRDPRKIWRYLPGLRQVTRDPQPSYLLPSLLSDGLTIGEDYDLFVGPADRYEWTLRGKRELYVPYNAYRLHSSALRTDDIVGKRHLAPEHLRYELHRVWVVEGTPKVDPRRHVYGRRVFYVDEDTWQILVADTYDVAGALIRVAEAHPVIAYRVPVPYTTLIVHYDFANGRYLVEGLDNRREPVRFREDIDSREFTPNALNYYVR